MENRFFTHFFSNLPGLLSFYTPLEHTQNFCVGLGGGVSFSGLAEGGTFEFGGSGMRMRIANSSPPGDVKLQLVEREHKFVAT